MRLDCESPHVHESCSFHVRAVIRNQAALKAAYAALYAKQKDAHAKAEAEVAAANDADGALAQQA